MVVRRSRIRRFSRRRRAQAAPRRVVRALPLRAVHFHSISNIELFPVAGVAVPTPGVGHNMLNAIPRGTSLIERTGNRTKLLSLIIVGGISFNPFRSAFGPSAVNSGFNTNNGDPGHWRYSQDVSLIIAWSPVSNGTVPSLLNYYAPSPNGAVDTWSLPLITDYPQLRILYRKNFQFNVRPIHSETGTPENPVRCVFALPPRVRNVRIKLPLRNLMTTFASGATVPTLADVASGSLFIYFLGDYSSGPSGGNPENFQRPIFSYESRLAFTNLD